MRNVLLGNQWLSGNQSRLEKILHRYGVSNEKYALCRAAYSGNIESIKYLIEIEKADLDSQDPNKGMTALHWAVTKK
jgi:ankyrin repeat protein